jgi:hypothetical protein
MSIEKEMKLLDRIIELELENDELKTKVWQLEKDVCYWQEACQNISEEAYEEHLEKGGSM